MINRAKSERSLKRAPINSMITDKKLGRITRSVSHGWPAKLNPIARLNPTAVERFANKPKRSGGPRTPWTRPAAKSAKLIRFPIMVGSLATELNIRIPELIKALMGMGIFANVNQLLNEEIGIKVGQNIFGGLNSLVKILAVDKRIGLVN